MASIRERTSTGGVTTWQVLFRHGGKQASRTFTNPDEAARWVKRIDLDGVERALQWLKDNDDRIPGITVTDLVRRYIDQRKRDITPRVADKYDGYLNNWITPMIGNREADLLTERDVQAWIDKMARAKTGNAASSIASRYALLSAAYKWGSARSRGLVTRNPCTEAEKPTDPPSAPKGTTLAEWEAILAAAAKLDPDAHDLILFLGSTGWRFSEATALAVRDVYDDGEHVQVSVTRVHRYVNGNQVLAEGKAKTRSAFRTVPVPRDTAAMLRRRIVGKPTTAYVFTTNGKPWHQTNFGRKNWKNLIAAAEVGNDQRKPTPHWLRHMAVAMMLSAGAPLHEVQKAIGHKNITTTMGTYGGLVSGLSSASIGAIDDFLAGKGRAGQVVSGELVTGDPAPQVLPLASPEVLQAHVDDID